MIQYNTRAIWTIIQRQTIEESLGARMSSIVQFFFCFGFLDYPIPYACSSHLSSSLRLFLALSRILEFFPSVTKFGNHQFLTQREREVGVVVRVKLCFNVHFSRSPLSLASTPPQAPS